MAAILDACVLVKFTNRWSMYHVHVDLCLVFKWWSVNRTEKASLFVVQNVPYSNGRPSHILVNHFTNRHPDSPVFRCPVFRWFL